ncbi:MAG: hypothetical protein HY925_00185 [Elusimicrobia bacterium]|nr:hypothetical protein [Elusimicrobiota bacterium]
MELRELLFADQDLDALLDRLPPEDRGLTRGSTRNPWPLLYMARALRAEGRLAPAAILLRQVGEGPDVETRVRLWAWRALRELRVRPEAGEAREVLGVVFELPLSMGVDTLAAYRDGTARYVNQGGAILHFRGEDPRISRLLLKLLGEAQPLAGGMPLAPRRVPPRARVRCSLLTREGIRSAEEELDLAGERGRFLSKAFRSAAELMFALAGDGEPPPR